MNQRRAFDIASSLGLCLVLGGVVSIGRADEPPASVPPAGEKICPPPTPGAGFTDEGVFLVYINEEPLASIQFKWMADGGFENRQTLTLGGQSVCSQMSIRPLPGGGWCEIAMDTPAGPVSITRENDGCRVVREKEKEAQVVSLEPKTVLFENFAPALMSQAVHLYDPQKGGKQGFPLFFLPERLMDVSLERLDTVDRPVGGCDRRFTRYRYTLAGVDIVLWTDGPGRIYLAEIPDRHAAYVREGYEILRQTPETDPLLSTAKYAVRVQPNVEVPMRDGVKLATDIYLPEADGPFPVVLTRTPYKKEMRELEANYFARRGYAFAVQDCRGRFSSPGQWEPLTHDAEDGYDTIEWLAAQPWSSGKVGMIGFSYDAWSQWLAASRRPPHLVTIIPSCSATDPLHCIPYENGVLALADTLKWVDFLESRASADLTGVAYRRLADKDYYTLFQSLPVMELDTSVLGGKNAYWRDWAMHSADDAFWQPISFLDRLGDVNLPVFHRSGWFDSEVAGTGLNYSRMVSYGHPHQKLIFGPWAHTWIAHRKYRGRDFGAEAVVDLQRAYLRWFDHWLKGVDNGIIEEPLVSVFVTGSNRWLHGDAYPLPQTRTEKWYLHSRGRANSARGDGWLSTEPPRPKTRPDHFIYDPGDPTPDPGFYPEKQQESAGEQERVRSIDEEEQQRTAYYEEVTRDRLDILVYHSRKFHKPYTFAGPISAELYAASSAPDTDWFVRLVELDEAGAPFKWVEGKLRARYRESISEPTLLQPGKVYKYRLDLGHTGLTVAPGHRLRVEIGSASFPSYSRNLNTGGHNEIEIEYVTAHQTVYHDANHPSHILLPVIPDADPP